MYLRNVKVFQVNLILFVHLRASVNFCQGILTIEVVWIYLSYGGLNLYESQYKLQMESIFYYKLITFCEFGRSSLKYFDLSPLHGTSIFTLVCVTCVFRPSSLRDNHRSSQRDPLEGPYISRGRSSQPRTRETSRGTTRNKGEVRPRETRKSSIHWLLSESRSSSYLPICFLLLLLSL